MQIEERNSLIKLFDTYGKLLSARQYEVMDKMLNLDLGESELAELGGESRQAIHDAITKAKKQLLVFEEKCGIVTNQMANIDLIKKVQIMLDNNEIDNAKQMIDDIIKKI